ncbi:MAG: hypothetical protein KBT29_12200 [Prevotellaceae bacterium]|nr:hypothetical protein [Candidatus Minthosoma caballi]
MWEEKPTSGKKSSNHGFEFVELSSEPALSEKGQSTPLSGSVENPTGINDAPLTLSSDGITTRIPIAKLLKIW